METEQEIHSRMLRNVGDEHDKSVGSFVYDATRPAAIEFEQKQKEIQAIQDKQDVEKLHGNELERFVYQRAGKKRKPATKSKDEVIISGSAGTPIKKGSLVGTDAVNFLVLSDVIIGESGLVTIMVECEEFGTIGNVPANSINKFPVTLPGLVNVYNPRAFKNGYDAESDKDLRQRYYDKLQRPGKAGNKYHYEEWAKSVTGVGDAKVFPRFNGPLTMKVTIIDANKQPATPDLVKKVREHIESEMSFGVEELKVVSAVGVPINISVTLTLADGYTVETVRPHIKTNSTKYLQEIAFKSSFVSYAKIGSLIIDSEGVLDYKDLLINGVATNISIGAEEVAIVGGVNE